MAIKKLFLRNDAGYNIIISIFCCSSLDSPDACGTVTVLGWKVGLGCPSLSCAAL